MHENMFTGSASAGAQEKMVEKQEEVTISIYFNMRGATPSGQISTKLGTCVRLANLIKRYRFIVSSSVVSTQWDVEFTMLPYRTPAVRNTLFLHNCATGLGDDIEKDNRIW